MTLSADELKELRAKAERSMFVVSLPTRTALSLIQAAELNAELVRALAEMVADAERIGIEDGLADQADPEIVDRARALLSKAKGSAGHG